MMLEKQSDLSTDEVSLKEIFLQTKVWFLYLITQWKTIVIVSLIGGGLGLSYARISKPIYTAATTFVLEESESAGNGLGQYAGLASMVGVNIGGTGNGGLFSGENIIELYKSRKMIEMALLSKDSIQGKEELLIERYITFKKLRMKWSESAELRSIDFSGESPFTLKHDSIINEIIKDLKENYLSVSKPDKKLNIIRVEVTAKDELFAKHLTEQLVQNVNDFYIKAKTKKTQENVEILQHQTDSVRAVMNGAIFSSAATLDATPNLNPVRQTLRAPIQRSQFSIETNKTILGELIKNLELAKLTLRQATPLIQVIDTPILPLEKKQIKSVMAVVIGILLGGILSIGYLVIEKSLK